MLDKVNFVEMLKKFFSTDKTLIGLHEPYFNGNEWAYVKECIDTGWVSSVGKFVDGFEKALGDFTGSKSVVATTNGTAALHMCYLLAGVSAGDEVLVPTLTFIGTINPILYCQAVPHFIDAEEKYLGIDPISLGDYLKEITQIKAGTCFNRYTGRPIRALCVMHTLGHSVDLDALLELANKYKLVLIEDAAEALGAFYKGTHVGNTGLVSALSFNGNKILTTGGGGAVLTNDIQLGKKAKHMTTTAKLPHPWLFEHDQTAYNYRLPNLNAALGCAQLENLTKFLQMKRNLATQYQELFKTVNEVRFISEPSYSQSNYWLNAIMINDATIPERDELLSLLAQSGIMGRPLWNLQHKLSMHSEYPRMPISVADKLVEKIITLPSSVFLTKNNKISDIMGLPCSV